MSFNFSKIIETNIDSLATITNGKYSKLLIVTASTNRHIYGKRSSLVKNSYLPTFPDSKAEILAVYLSASYQALFRSILLF